jgi:hypothetical protein
LIHSSTCCRQVINRPSVAVAAAIRSKRSVAAVVCKLQIKTVSAAAAANKKTINKNASDRSNTYVASASRFNPGPVGRS